MTLFFYIMLSLSTLTLITIFFILKKDKIIHLWKMAKIKGQNQKDKTDFIKKQTAKGLKPFSFENGKTIVYAKNGNRALADYKRLKDNTKNLKK